MRLWAGCSCFHMKLPRVLAPGATAAKTVPTGPFLPPRSSERIMWAFLDVEVGGFAVPRRARESYATAKALASHRKAAKSRSDNPLVV